MNLNDAVLARKEQMIKSLQENLRIPSVRGEEMPDAPYGVEVKKALLHALETAKDLGFKTCNVDYHMGWCEYGEGDEMVAVLAHLDVVPEGDGWTYEPYGAEISDGKIWARGTTDDKGPAIAALYALAALRDSELLLNRRVRVLFGCNEETGSNDVEYYLSHGGEVPVMGFTPDGEYPVINGEKGILISAFSKQYEQSGELKLLSVKGGTAANVVPNYAVAEFSCPLVLADEIVKTNIPKVNFTLTENGFKVEAFGVSAHGSIPETGENAICRLLGAMNTLPLSEELKSTLSFLYEKVGRDTCGKAAGIYLCDEVSGPLSLNLGTISGDELKLTVEINYRYPVTFSYDDCATAFNKLFDDAGFALDSETHSHKLYFSEGSLLVKSLLKVYEEQTGFKDKPKCIGGGTYAKSMPNILAFGPVFPGEEAREHQSDEYITVDNLVKNARIIAAAMYELAK